MSDIKSIQGPETEILFTNKTNVTLGDLMEILGVNDRKKIICYLILDTYAKKGYCIALEKNFAKKYRRENVELGIKRDPSSKKYYAFNMKKEIFDFTDGRKVISLRGEIGKTYMCIYHEKESKITFHRRSDVVKEVDQVTDTGNQFVSYLKDEASIKRFKYDVRSHYDKYYNNNEDGKSRSFVLNYFMGEGEEKKETLIRLRNLQEVQDSDNEVTYYTAQLKDRTSVFFFPQEDASYCLVSLTYMKKNQEEKDDDLDDDGGDICMFCVDPFCFSGSICGGGATDQNGKGDSDGTGSGDDGVYDDYFDVD